MMASLIQKTKALNGIQRTPFNVGQLVKWNLFCNVGAILMTWSDMVCDVLVV